MTKYAVGLAMALALTLAATAVSQSQKEKKKEDPDLVAARGSTLDLVKIIEDEKAKKDDVSTKVAAIRKAHELDHLMKIYKPKESGGIGYAGKEGKENGLENKLQSLTRGRGPSAATLKKEEADLLKLARVNLAMAEVVKPYFNKPMKGKGKKDWEKYADDQKAGAEDLIKAIKAHDQAAVKKAAEKLIGSCTDCHGPFRSSAD